MDPMGALASGGLSNWVQNQAITSTTPPPPPGWPKDNPYQANFLDSFSSGMNTAFVQALTQLYLVNAPKEILARYADGYSNAFIAVPWDAKDYNLTPGPDAGKPRAYGPQLAVVVGPQGSKNIAAGGDSDLYADGLGRVRVRFPWQREVPTGANQSGSTDPLQTDRRTCWVSVSESWAGANFGTQFLPRIGQEVIVSFLDGDPERPIITGRRYNADHGYSNLPFPPDEVDVEVYDMDDWNGPGPSNNFPFNGIKTASTKTARADSSGGKSRYHLMRFDDTYNCEQLLLRSQGRLDVTAYASNFDTAYGNRNLKTAKGTDKDGKPIGGNMFNTIDGEYDVHVGGSHYTQVEKDYELTVKGDVKADLKRGADGGHQGRRQHLDELTRHRGDPEDHPEGRRELHRHRSLRGASERLQRLQDAVRFRGRRCLRDAAEHCRCHSGRAWRQVERAPDAMPARRRDPADRAAPMATVQHRHRVVPRCMAVRSTATSCRPTAPASPRVQEARTPAVRTAVAAARTRVPAVRDRARRAMS